MKCYDEYEDVDQITHSWRTAEADQDDGNNSDACMQTLKKIWKRMRWRSEIS
jgi:hypothetical protein